MTSISIRILLTEAAKSVQRAPTFQVTPDLQPLLMSIQTWDTVTIPPCSTGFLVIGRAWTIRAESAELVVLLGLDEDRPQLRAV